MITKCSCQHCGNPIEFEAEQSDAVVVCPHCGKETALGVRHQLQPAPSPAAPAAKSGQAKPGKYSPLVAGLILAVVVLLVSCLILLRRTSVPSVVPVAMALNPKSEITKAETQNDHGAKSIKIESIQHGYDPDTLGGGGYIVSYGIARNISSKTLEMVTIEYSLFDDKTNQVDTGEMVTQNLPPNQTWRFKSPEYSLYDTLKITKIGAY